MSRAVFENKSIRWMIYSYVNDVDIWKGVFNNVLEHLMWKVKFRDEVLIQFRPDARLVVFDEYGPCSNCYHYGDQEMYGSVDGVCCNHVGQIPDYWMCYKEFLGISGINFMRSYEEYEEARLDEYWTNNMLREEWLEEFDFFN